MKQYFNGGVIAPCEPASRASYLGRLFAYRVRFREPSRAVGNLSASMECRPAANKQYSAIPDTTSTRFGYDAGSPLHPSLGSVPRVG